MATVQKFTDLEVWKLGKELQEKIFLLYNEAPLKTDFALRDLMNRSSGSIPDNIAEGFDNGGTREFIQFLGIAGASVSELRSQLIQCLSRKYIDKQVFEEISELIDRTGNKIDALTKSLHVSEFELPKFQNTVARNEKHETQNAANEKPETGNDLIKTENAARPLGAYPHARKVGDFLFLSGIGSRQASDNKIPGLELDAEGNILKYDIEAECRSVFTNVKAVLEASGSSWEKMVDVTVFLTNMKADFAAYNKIYGEYFKDVEACRTTVEVKSLPTPIAIELKVIATR